MHLFGVDIVGLFLIVPAFLILANVVHACPRILYQRGLIIFRRIAIFCCSCITICSCCFGSCVPERLFAMD